MLAEMVSLRLEDGIISQIVDYLGTMSIHFLLTIVLSVAHHYGVHCAMR